MNFALLDEIWDDTDNNLESDNISTSIDNNKTNDNIEHFNDNIDNNIDKKKKLNNDIIENFNYEIIEKNKMINYLKNKINNKTNNSKQNKQNNNNDIIILLLFGIIIIFIIYGLIGLGKLMERNKMEYDYSKKLDDLFKNIKYNKYYEY
jgi:hypothetical protein